MSEALSVSPRVIDLVCSRICHDLISPISAINNGIELINDTGEGTNGEAFSLITDSAAIVASRLALMRYSFGAATPSLDEVREVALTYFVDSKVSIVWPKTGLSPDMATRQGFPKVLLNMVLVLAESIGANGTITMTSPEPDQLIATAEAKSGTIRNDTLSGLTSTSPESLDARTIQAYIAALLIKRFGYTLTQDVKETRIVFMLR